jgi:hypothetical protein
MVNTRMHYQYRDADNYKAGGYITVAGEITRAEIERILACLDEGEWFIPSQIGLMDLQGQLQQWDTELSLDENGRNPSDHAWHELTADDFELVESEAEEDWTVEQLVEAFEQAEWDPADPRLDF